MIKGIFSSLFLSLVLFKSYGQIVSKKNHAFKMQVIYNTDGSTKGWFPCDFYVEFKYDKNELKNISFSVKDKNLKVTTRKRASDKFNYESYTKDENLEYRMYDGFDDLTGEDVKMLVGYNTSNNQLKPVSITLIYMLSSNYIALN